MQLNFPLFTDAESEENTRCESLCLLMAIRMTERGFLVFIVVFIIQPRTGTNLARIFSLNCFFMWDRNRKRCLLGIDCELLWGLVMEYCEIIFYKFKFDKVFHHPFRNFIKPYIIKFTPPLINCEHRETTQPSSPTRENIQIICRAQFTNSEKKKTYKLMKLFQLCSFSHCLSSTSHFCSFRLCSQKSTFELCLRRN